MKFFAGFITSSILIALMVIGFWLYFDFPIPTNNEQQEKQEEYVEPETSTQENDYVEQPTEQKHNDYETTATKNEMSSNEEKPEHLPNLHDKQKAIDLMKHERYSLSNEDKQIFDGVIETAKTNINNNVGTHEDYNILNTYKNLDRTENINE